MVKLAEVARSSTGIGNMLLPIRRACNQNCLALNGALPPRELYYHYDMTRHLAFKKLLITYRVIVYNAAGNILAYSLHKTTISRANAPPDILNQVCSLFCCTFHIVSWYWCKNILPLKMAIAWDIEIMFIVVLIIFDVIR